MKRSSIIAILTGIVGLWVLSPIVLAQIFDPASERALFADSYGVINSLFSGLALAGVIIAILMQKEELELQRKELELTREEIAKSAVANEESADALKQAAELSLLRAKLEGEAAMANAASSGINAHLQSFNLSMAERSDLGESVERLINAEKRIADTLRAVDAKMEEAGILALQS